MMKRKTAIRTIQPPSHNLPTIRKQADDLNKDIAAEKNKLMVLSNYIHHLGQLLENGKNGYRAETLKKERITLLPQKQSLLDKINTMISKHAGIVSQIEAVNKQNKLAGKIKFTDHARVRYIERVMGIDITTIENKIISPQIAAMIKTLGGTGTYPHENGFSVVMKDHFVLTIIK